MKLKILRNLGKNEFPSCPHKDGEVCEVEDAIAETLIARNLALQIIEPAKVEEPKPVEIEEPVKQFKSFKKGN